MSIYVSARRRDGQFYPFCLRCPWEGTEPQTTAIGAMNQGRRLHPTCEELLP